MRLTIALEPAIPVAERLILLQEDLSDPFHLLGADARWVPPESIRLVLYTGEIEQGALGFARVALREALQTVAPFDYETYGSRFVPDENQPRLVAVGTRAGAEALSALRDVTLTALRPTGPTDEDQLEWRPLTAIARLKTQPGTPPLTGVLRPYSETEYGTSRAVDVVVSVTEVHGGQVRARQLERIPLAG